MSAECEKHESDLVGGSIRNGDWPEQSFHGVPTPLQIKLHCIDQARIKVENIARMVVDRQATIGTLQYALEELDDIRKAPL